MAHRRRWTLRGRGSAPERSRPGAARRGLRAWAQPNWEVTWLVPSRWRRLSPPQLLAGSFVILILIGTLGLRLLPGLYTGARLGWIDSLFTATSAVCVTGLVVVDTATWFTPLGQAFVLLLIQLGGLGIITFTTIVILALGRRLSLQHETITVETASIAPIVNYRHLARAIVLFTLLVEAIGAGLLMLSWVPRLGPVGAWHALFHAISAFCNAGFSTFSDSMIGFQLQPAVLLTIAGLIVIGGIGFVVMDELYLWRRLKRNRRELRRLGGIIPRVSLHTRLVLATTATLILTGWLLLATFEWRVSLSGLPAWAKLTNALFMSITPRTAGFNNVDYSQVSDPGNFLTLLLMAIGGSPGSTAGGLKTTSFALIGLLAWARLRGRTTVDAYGRTVPEETIQRAVGLFVVCFAIMTMGVFLLLLTEVGGLPAGHGGRGLLPYMFEVASAFNTVGLSMDVTPELSTAGRVIAIMLMYLGRVGPLTFAAAIAVPRGVRAREFRYAHEEVVIG
jgi:trk system potassium uptake protein TrkH